MSNERKHERRSANPETGTGLAAGDTLPVNGETPTLVVLGTLQDAGAPHAGCNRECCRVLFHQPRPDWQVVCLGVVDPVSRTTWLFEATPDLPRQMQRLQQLAPFETGATPDGIFLTHAHIGHYTGLMYLGREALNAQRLPVYAMPRMRTFLAQNGPWSQLVQLENIALRPLADQQPVALSEQIRVTPFTVPHRDEYSETVGYRIDGPKRSAVFIPDIDKWHRWDGDLETLLGEVDYALVDGTFYNAAEINYRDMSEIPHPFIVESMARFEALPPEIRSRIHFIHFNHTNPVLRPDSPETDAVRAAGFQLARPGMRLGL